MPASTMSGQSHPLAHRGRPLPADAPVRLLRQRCVALGCLSGIIFDPQSRRSTPSTGPPEQLVGRTGCFSSDGARWTASCPHVQAKTLQSSIWTRRLLVRLQEAVAEAVVVAAAVEVRPESPATCTCSRPGPWRPPARRKSGSGFCRWSMLGTSGSSNMSSNSSQIAWRHGRAPCRGSTEDRQVTHRISAIRCHRLTAGRHQSSSFAATKTQPC